MLRFWLAATGLAASQALWAADLTVVVDRIPDGRGSVRVGLYNDAARFPTVGGQWRTETAPARAAGVSVTFRDVPPGRYAVGLFHDANDNHKLDENLIGVPTEGFGFSHNPRVTLSAPSFDAAAFDLGATPRTLAVHLQ